MKDQWNNAESESLFNAILAIDNVNEAKLFFRDLLTENEIIEFSNRWKVAQMLNKKVPYSQIEKSTGLSSTTIARISSWLNKGTGGYTLMLNRMNHRHHASTSPDGKRTS